MHNPRLERDKLDLLRAAVVDARRIIARGVDSVEETKRLVIWLRRLDSPLLGLRPPPESE